LANFIQHLLRLVQIWRGWLEAGPAPALYTWEKTDFTPLQEGS
jgi:hypothetical protein